MDNTRTLLHCIQNDIQRKGDQMAWVDACCLQITVNRQLYTFQTDSPQVRNDWVTGERVNYFLHTSVFISHSERCDFESQNYD